MVSSVFRMPVEELVERLDSIANEYAGDPEYAELRTALPVEFPF